MIPNVTITTDNFWLINADELPECFTFTGANSPVAAPTTPTTISVPVSSPGTASPAYQPAMVPFDASVTEASTGDDDNGKLIGLFVGGIVAGIIIVATIGFVKRRKRKNFVVEESMEQNQFAMGDSIAHSSLSATSCRGDLPPPVSKAPQSTRTLHKVGSEVAVIENASLAMVLEVSDISQDRAEPSGVYEGWQA